MIESSKKKYLKFLEMSNLMTKLYKYNNVAYDQITKYNTYTQHLIFMIQSYSIQFTLLNATVLRLMRLDPIRSTNLSLPLDIISFHLVIS